MKLFPIQGPIFENHHLYLCLREYVLCHTNPVEYLVSHIYRFHTYITQSFANY